MTLPHEGCAHEPTVSLVAGHRYLTCSKCGLMLDFRSLDEMGVNTSDWTPAPAYTAPESVR